MSVAFDPGYSKCVLGIAQTFDELQNALMSSHSLSQKQMRFKGLYPKLIKAIEDNVAFYLGCMLWALYLKSLKGQTIEGNVCLDKNYDKDACSYEVSVLLNYINAGLSRDSKYYLNQIYEPKPEDIIILERYKEFLDANKGFFATKTTDDIVLPKNLKMPNADELEEIKSAIESAIETNNIQKLMVYSSLITSL